MHGHGSEMSTPLRPLRPLLPAVDLSRPGNRTSEPSRRYHVTAACESCRRRKAKCSGERPACKACVQRSLDCRYTTSSAETHSQALKRKYNDLIQQQNNNSPHEDLFELFKSMTDKEALGIVRRIKSGHDVITILNHVRDGNLLLQLHLTPESRLRYEFPYRRQMPAFIMEGTRNPYLESLVYEFTASPDTSAAQKHLPTENNGHLCPYLRPYQAAILVEPLLSDVKISNWTSVAVGESLLGRLMHEYFLHQYPCWPLLHKDYFLRDLKSGRQQFCSSLLVNAILADACHYGLRQLDHRNEPWNPSNLGYQFFAEARRLYDLEMGKTKLTTVQAGLILQMAFAMDGLDKIGWAYMRQVVQMSTEMNLFDSTDIKNKELQRVRDLTAWGVFTMQAIWSFNYSRAPLIPRPPKNMPPDPLQDPKWYITHANYVFRNILNEINTLASQNEGSHLSLEEAMRYYKKFQSWMDALPGCLGPRNIAMPTHIRIHIYYWLAMIGIFEPHVVSAEPQVDLQSSESELSETPQDIITRAKIYLETLVRLFYLRHSFEIYDPTMVHVLSVFSVASISGLATVDADPERIEARNSTMILAAKGIRDQARSCQLARVVSQLIRGSLPPENAWLWDEGIPPEVAKDDELHMLRHTESNYPLNIGSSAGTSEKRNVEHLVKEMMGATLDDRSDPGVDEGS